MLIKAKTQPKLKNTPRLKKKNCLDQKQNKFLQTRLMIKYFLQCI